MSTTAVAENQITITEQIFVKATLETTFKSLLTQLGPMNQTTDGKPLTMILEAKPGGRWYRDLGGDNGHLWGFVQSIKRPSLLEIWGPLFISTGATSNVMYRLAEVNGGTEITFTHKVIGLVPEEFHQRMPLGWEATHARVKQQAEGNNK